MLVHLGQQSGYTQDIMLNDNKLRLSAFYTSASESIAMLCLSGAPAAWHGDAGITGRWLV